MPSNSPSLYGLWGSHVPYSKNLIVTGEPFDSMIFWCNDDWLLSLLPDIKGLVVHTSCNVQRASDINDIWKRPLSEEETAHKMGSSREGSVEKRMVNHEFETSLFTTTEYRRRANAGTNYAIAFVSHSLATTVIHAEMVTSGNPELPIRYPAATLFTFRRDLSVSPILHTRASAYARGQDIEMKDARAVFSSRLNRPRAP